MKTKFQKISSYDNSEHSHEIYDENTENVNLKLSLAGDDLLYNNNNPCDASKLDVFDLIKMSGTYEKGQLKTSIPSPTYRADKTYPKHTKL